MPSPMSSPATRTTPLPVFVRRALAEQAAEQNEIVHPSWCTRTRCDGWLGRDHHLGVPVLFPGADDVEFGLRRYQSGDDPSAWMLTLRRLATVDTVEVVVSDRDLDELLGARDRLLERELGVHGGDGVVTG